VIVTQALVIIAFCLMLVGLAIREMADGRPNSGPIAISAGFGVLFLAAVLYAALAS
jgi:hypothetical protein